MLVSKLAHFPGRFVSHDQEVSGVQKCAGKNRDHGFRDAKCVSKPLEVWEFSSGVPALPEVDIILTHYDFSTFDGSDTYAVPPKSGNAFLRGIRSKSKTKIFFTKLKALVVNQQLRFQSVVYTAWE